MDPKLIGFLQGIGLTLILSACGYMADASNLSGYFNPVTAALISGIALSIENAIQARTGKALFGSVRM